MPLAREADNDHLPFPQTDFRQGIPITGSRSRNIHAARKGAKRGRRKRETEERQQRGSLSAKGESDDFHRCVIRLATVKTMLRLGSLLARMRIRPSHGLASSGINPFYGCCARARARDAYIRLLFRRIPAVIPVNLGEIKLLSPKDIEVKVYRYTPVLGARFYLPRN